MLLTRGVCFPVNYLQRRCISLSLIHFASHYEVLGLNKKSTQNEIKTAYYNLSKIYHPDINSDEAAALKFRAITEAYEVLGNVRSKKLYDKGVFQGFSPRDTTPETPAEKFYKSRITRDRPPLDYDQPIYNFDAWTAAHYGDTFKTSRERKAEYDKMKNMRKNNVVKDTNQYVYYILFSLGFSFLYFSLMWQDYDKILPENKSKPKT